MKNELAENFPINNNICFLWMLALQGGNTSIPAQSRALSNLPPILVFRKLIKDYLSHGLHKINEVLKDHKNKTMCLNTWHAQWQGECSLEETSHPVCQETKSNYFLPCKPESSMAISLTFMVNTPVEILSMTVQRLKLKTIKMEK